MGHITLAIETSCDDTSLALVRDEGNFCSCLAMVSYTQAMHDQYGGVVPELASRSHAEQIIPVMQSLVTKAGYADLASLMDAVDSISVTVSPGLPGSLMIGKTFAHMLSTYYHKPFIPVNHLYGHVFSVLLEQEITDAQYPMVVLSVSGGHSDLYKVELQVLGSKLQVVSSQELVGKYMVTKLGGTRDDAVGEVFDKVARMLGGPYPGGKWVGEKAEEFRIHNAQCTIHNSEFTMHNDEGESPSLLVQCTYKKILLEKGSLDFSFSGMKSQTYQFLCDMAGLPRQSQDPDSLHEHLSEIQKGAIAYSFQETATDILITKLQWAVEQTGAKSIAVVGGVSANSRLRERLQVLSDQLQISFFLPTKFVYCTDNAAMIGVVGLIQSRDQLCN